MKKILVIGNGGREHTICDALNRSPQKPEIVNFATAINPGIKKLGAEIVVGNIMDLGEIKDIGAMLKPDFAIVGPDDPIGIGAADALREIGIPTFAPSKKCAQLEGSKSFTRNLLAKYDIDASPAFEVYESDNVECDLLAGEMKKFFDKFEGQIVVKADGLLGGKGVLVAEDHFETDDFETPLDFAKKSIEKFGRVVFEERLLGEEFSLISIVDGETVLDTPAIQDHKRAFEGDKGPNTGGMGCVSDENLSLPFLDKDDLAAAHQITVDVMHAMKKELGEKFVGVMYGGFIKTSRGVKLIEYNARFGDPEALNILPILESDAVEVFEKAIAGDLASLGELKFRKVATVVKYLCPDGYPDNPVKNVSIKVEDYEENENQRVFFASVAENEDGEMILKGSRAVGILGTGADFAQALANCESMLEKFSGPLFYRKDIGTSELIEKRVSHMNDILNK